ncbi:hypothetical protein [Brevundimonas sp.]|uniref:hypothetical protein n=1 Tax=Brevundimonas sp. TaxID=1871086 RepID=UPI002D3A54DE|nr:hypothetical protein [Brevundimonas sp.]HYC97875.1 hypothetical protein [Brevundimonas sp.]
MGFAKLLIAWALSMAVYAASIHAWYAVQGRATTASVKGGALEAFMGLGVLLAIPGFLFAVVVGWPILSRLGALRPAWLVPLVAAGVLAALMWGLAMLMLPAGWRGAGYALAGYAAVLGLVWGCLDLAIRPAR